jgi:predicted RND superfamily exporter protein
MFYNKLSRAFFTLLPSLFAMSWVTILVHVFNIQISAYSSIAFVLLIGASVDGSLQLWSSYYEKQGGNAWTVLQTKLISTLIAQGASFIGALAMLFSSHPGINGMGQIAVLGLICIFISQFTIYPLVASTLDAYRILKKAKHKHEKLIR